MKNCSDEPPKRPASQRVVEVRFRRSGHSHLAWWVDPGLSAGGIRPLRPHKGIRCTPRIPGRKTGFQSGTVVPRSAKDLASDGVEPGHTSRPRVRSKSAHAVEFSKTVAPLREGSSFPGRVRDHLRSRSGPVSIAPRSPRREGRPRRGRQRSAPGLGPRCAPPGPRGGTVAGWPTGPDGDGAYDRTWTVTMRRWGRRLRQHLHRNRPLAGPIVEVDQNDLLPGPEREPAVDDRDRL